jgi:hypothetical protein
MSEINTRVRWLARKYLDEHSLHFRTAWQFYLTFYVAFLTLNGGALGLTVQNVTSTRAKALIAATFVFQNLIAAGTAIMMARYSSVVAEQLEAIAPLSAQIPSDSVASLLPQALRKSPIPANLGWWSGVANLMGHIVFIALWIVVAAVKFH